MEQRIATGGAHIRIFRQIERRVEQRGDGGSVVRLVWRHAALPTPRFPEHRRIELADQYKILYKS
jgi:hypothetical protein